MDIQEIIDEIKETAAKDFSMDDWHDLRFAIDDKIDELYETLNRPEKLQFARDEAQTGFFKYKSYDKNKVGVFKAELKNKQTGEYAYKTTYAYANDDYADKLLEFCRQLESEEPKND